MACSYSELIQILSMFFDPEDGDESVQRVTRMFYMGKDAEYFAAYSVNAKKLKMFWLLIQYIGIGPSFLLVSRKVTVAREELKMGYLGGGGGCSELVVRFFVRVALAANLKKLKDLLVKCWELYIAFDSVAEKITSLFDILVRFTIDERLF